MAKFARACVCALILLAAAQPATADAKVQCGKAPAPTGNSEVNQYIEGVPGPCGPNQVTGGAGNPGGGSGGSVVPAQTRKQLQSKGADGQAAAALADATAPGNPGSGGVSGVSRSSDKGIGLLLPLILAATLLAGILYFVRRRRAGLA
jgi:hypothetical protein